MRTMILVLAAAVLMVAVWAACRARDDSAGDSTAGDTARADESTPDSGVAANDIASPPPLGPRVDKSRTSPEIRRARDPVRDSALPPEDSIRAMRPHLPQVTPGKRPRTWRGFKLPEEMPVRVPLETIRRVEELPDSVMKGDSTKPPKPDR
jgi:hypothetical protein